MGASLTSDRGELKCVSVSPSDGLVRRDVLRLTVVGAVALSAAGLTGCAAPRTDGSNLSVGQARLVADIVDTILPRTDTPSASEVGVHRFIEELWSRWLKDADRERITAGLMGIDTAAQEAGGDDFAGLSPVKRTELLTAIERGEDVAVSEAVQPALAQLKGLAVVAYFTTEPIATTMLTYDPVPGEYQACVSSPEDFRTSYVTQAGDNLLDFAAVAGEAGNSGRD